MHEHPEHGFAEFSARDFERSVLNCPVKNHIIICIFILHLSLPLDIIKLKKVRFKWDAKKDKQNQEKHGVSFEFAQYAFTDPDRIIAEDLNHSQK